MLTLFRSDKIHTLAEIQEALRRQIQRFPQMISPIGTPLTIIRFEFPCQTTNILSWLKAQAFNKKIYFSNRKKSFEMAGVGIADSISCKTAAELKSSLEYIEDHLCEDNPYLRYYGGMSFNTNTKEKDWKDFPNFYFAVPRFELISTSEETIFTFNVALKDVTEENLPGFLKEVEQLNPHSDESFESLPEIQKRRDRPDRKEWDAIFQDVVKNIKNQKYQKIVLARKSDFTFNKTIDPVILIKQLKEETPHCYHFCFQVDEATAFIGATPERLFRRSEDTLKSEAIAGTIQRGKNKEDDAQLENRLLNSSKNAREHQFVVDAIKDVFRNLCKSFAYDKSCEILKLKGGHHLITRFKGELLSNVTNYEILQALHPTPAVAGTPTAASLKEIERLEKFDRGWYAGPVGYIGHDECALAVAIRSGLVLGKNLSLYAGAGIIEESHCEEEWNEIENKIERFIKIFEYEHSQNS